MENYSPRRCSMPLSALLTMGAPSFVGRSFPNGTCGAGVDRGHDLGALQIFNI